MPKGPRRIPGGRLLHNVLYWDHEADLTCCPVCHTPLDESTGEWRGAQHKQRMIRTPNALLDPEEALAPVGWGPQTSW